jgi:mono/diheme cytochrome c family protein
MRILAALVILVALAAAKSGNKSSESNAVAPSAPTQNATQATAEMRVEGEKRFRTNCGRCHMPPHKFPPRMMATIARHMRVRALITDEDMRYILAYMTQ